MNDWLEKNLVCPRDLADLVFEDAAAVCVHGHSYPCIDGIPVMLVAEERPTHGECIRALAQAESDATAEDVRESGDDVDAYVQDAVAATCGYMYRPLVRRLKRYPIPRLRLPPGDGMVLVDLGCNWGRWCISAERCGYRAVGIDPSLDAIRAARRVADQLGASPAYLVADARHLPFRSESIDVVYSYSVLQHFARDDVRAAAKQVARVLKPKGRSTIQILNAWGLRSFYHQARRGFREGRNFEVRYWRPSELRETFSRLIGPTTITVDGFFSANVQPADLDLLPPYYRLVVHLSELLRRTSSSIPFLTYLADSVYVESMRPSNGTPC